MMLFNIPAHTRCIGCGECCGPVPVSIEDMAKIARYVANSEYAQEVAARQHAHLDCIFRDHLKGRCSIYPVRPVICRMFGVDVNLQCPNGNSANIDGSRIVAQDGFAAMMNDWPWEEENEKAK